MLIPPPDSLHVQTNLLIGSLAATVRTDAERYVAIATLETLEDLLRCLRELSFPLAEAPLESLLVSVHDVLEMKVTNLTPGVIKVGHHGIGSPWQRVGCRHSVRATRRRGHPEMSW